MLHERSAPIVELVRLGFVCLNNVRSSPCLRFHTGYDTFPICVYSHARRRSAEPYTGWAILLRNRGTNRETVMLTRSIRFGSNTEQVSQASDVDPVINKGGCGVDRFSNFSCTQQLELTAHLEYLRCS